jgi:PD-(D/E)XK nuclease superfamily
MEDSLFTLTEGYSGEDLTTAALKYLLNDSENIRSFFKNIESEFNIGLRYDSESTIYIQSEEPFVGRFDIRIDGPKYNIVVENKFYAAFSQGNQIERYLKYLQNDKTDRMKILIILTINDREDYYKAEIVRGIGKNIKTIEELQRDLLKQNITMLFITWECMLEWFKNKIEISNEIKEYIKTNYIIDTILTDEELKMKNENCIPDILDKYWNSVSKLREKLIIEKCKTGRMSQSQKYYGFYANINRVEIWIGYSQEMWKKYGKQFIIQINIEEKNKFAEEYKRIGFKYDDGLGFLYLIGNNENDPYIELQNKTFMVVKKLIAVLC